ncbi:MAG: hypothetical protein LBT21_07090 [Oscillospiraceae bacterium]|jgi:hypothetical protein|nr:hypothetical protein [Oscillospiraceae bacterium]
MDSATVLRLAGQMGKAAKIFGTLSQILSVVSLIALAGGAVLFCRQLVKSRGE